MWPPLPSLGRRWRTNLLPVDKHPPLPPPRGAPCSFYFVSDPTLLEILSLGSDPPSVVPHFQSGLFDSLTNVTFDKADRTRMLEMFSQQGEKVRVRARVRWLGGGDLLRGAGGGGGDSAAAQCLLRSCCVRPTWHLPSPATPTHLPPCWPAPDPS